MVPRVLSTMTGFAELKNALDKHQHQAACRAGTCMIADSTAGSFHLVATVFEMLLGVSMSLRGAYNSYGAFRSGNCIS